MLADAIGDHESGALPTVQELTDLIADLEVRTFIGPTRIDPELLTTGWYLHGIASASAASDTYSPARQRQAFAVSAHVFDLALADSDRTVQQQLTLAFGAQVGYRRASLDPNATAIWRRVNKLLDAPASERSPYTHSASGPAQHLDVALLGLRAGVAFLGLDVARISVLLRDWRGKLFDLRASLEMESLDSTMFGPAAAVVSAVSNLMTFLRYGHSEQLAAALGDLDSVLDMSAGEGDHDSRWVASHLRSIAGELESSSIWSVLPDGTPSAVAQAFTVGSPPALTLWPPQVELLTRSIGNPLSPDTKRLLLSVPTSAGKTLIAQVLICHQLATQPGNVCYVTPLRSLGREMRQALAGRLRVLAKGMGLDLADFADADIDELLSILGSAEDHRVDVMTPERLAHILRRDPEAIAQYSLFVIDEAHLLAQPGRGFLLESLLAILVTMDVKLFLLSGVMGNAAQISSWLSPSIPEVLFSSSWRGPRRLHALLYSDILWDDEESLPLRSATFTRRVRYPMVGDLRVRAAEGRVHRLSTSRELPIGEYERSTRRDGSLKHTRTPFYKLCARTAAALLPAGSLLMVLSRRDYARNAAQEVASGLPVSDLTVKLCGFLEERLGEEHPLVHCVRRGVAYHHAGLPVDVLDAIEQAMRSERLLAIFATSTLTDGVNLPVRTVLICESRYEGQDPGQQLDAPRLLNALGRAGRAGRETEGWIILALNQAHDDSNFEILRPADEDLEIRTSLDSEQALQELADIERLVATTADALFVLPDGAAADFAAYVWFVLSASERLAAIGSPIDLSQAVHSLLAFTQLPGDIKERWLALAQSVHAEFAQTSAASRLRWTVSGASLGSAREIERIASDFARHLVARDLSEEPDQNDMIELLDAIGAFDRLLQLPEAADPWKFKVSVAARTSLDVPVSEALRLWMSGLSMPALAAALLPTVADASWRLEQTVDAVSGTFEHFLSWTVGVVIDQTADLLREMDAETSIPRTFAYMIRYGVDTRIALSLITNGVTSRRLAHLIGRAAVERSLSLREVRRWLRELHVTGWRAEFDASDREVEELIDFCRTVNRSALRELLEDGTTVLDIDTVGPHAREAPWAVIEGQDAEFRYAARSDLVEVWSKGSEAACVGAIVAASHADTHLILSSGVEFDATLEQGRLRLNQSRQRSLRGSGASSRDAPIRRARLDLSDYESVFESAFIDPDNAAFYRDSGEDEDAYFWPVRRWSTEDAVDRLFGEDILEDQKSELISGLNGRYPYWALREDLERDWGV